MKTLKVFASILLALLFASCESGFDDMLDDADMGKAALQSFTTTPGTLGPEFNRGTTSYNLFAGNGVASVDVEAIPVNPDSTIKYRIAAGSWLNGSTITVSGLSTTPVKLEIRVTSGDGQGEVVYSFDVLAITSTARVTYISESATVRTKDITYPATTVGTLEPAPVRNGYRFTGWWTQASGGTMFTAATTVSANTSVYAQWQASSAGLAYTVLGDGTYSVAKGSFTTGNLVIPDYYNGQKVTVIANTGFTLVTGITGITFGNNITTIGTSAFRGCTGLTAVTIPDSVTTIGSDAFYETQNITSVVIGNSVVTIGSSAFEDANLTTLVIPDSVTTIGVYAFGNCSFNLQTLTIGSNVSSIGNDAFGSGSALKTLYMRRLSAPTLGTGNFTSTTGCTLHLRTGNSGYNAAPWSTAGKFTQVTDL